MNAGIWIVVAYLLPTEAITNFNCGREPAMRTKCETSEDACLEATSNTIKSSASEDIFSLPRLLVLTPFTTALFLDKSHTFGTDHVDNFTNNDTTL